jgi:hypothetical protein
MDVYRDVMKHLKHHEVILAVLMIVYSAFDVEAPHWLNDFVMTGLGSLVVMLVAISFFLYMNPIVAILGLVAAYELISRARLARHGDTAMIDYLPKTQPHCSDDLNAYNQFSKTLEQEMVEKMAPLVGPAAGPVTYHAVMSNDHDAAPLH